MMRKLYLALRRAGVEESEASEAAEEVAAYDHRLHHIESRLNLLTSMVGANIALSIGIFIRLLP